MITVNEIITEDSFQETATIIYCPYCGCQNRFNIDYYSRKYYPDIPGILFCVECGKQL